MLLLMKLYDCISTWLKRLPLCSTSLEKNPLVWQRGESCACLFTFGTDPCMCSVFGYSLGLRRCHWGSLSMLRGLHITPASVSQRQVVSFSLCVLWAPSSLDSRAGQQLREAFEDPRLLKAGLGGMPVLQQLQLGWMSWVSSKLLSSGTANITAAAGKPHDGNSTHLGWLFFAVAALSAVQYPGSAFLTYQECFCELWLQQWMPDTLCLEGAVQCWNEYVLKNKEYWRTNFGVRANQ